MTLVLVTHDPALAARCSRQVRVRSGRIEPEMKEPEAVWKRLSRYEGRSVVPLRSCLPSCASGNAGRVEGFLHFPRLHRHRNGGIAAVNSVSSAMTRSIASQGTTLLVAISGSN